MKVPESVILKLQHDVYPMSDSLKILESKVDEKFEELLEMITEFNTKQKELVDICEFISSNTDGFDLKGYKEGVMTKRLVNINIVEDMKRKMK